MKFRYQLKTSDKKKAVWNNGLWIDCIERGIIMIEGRIISIMIIIFNFINLGEYINFKIL